MYKIKIRPVNKSNWKDFETLFESRGCPHHCWCMAWRPKEKDAEKAWKKSYMQREIINNVPVGLLAYSLGEAVAWCSVAPRETYRNLGGDNTIVNVWSLVCFFIKRDFRGKGLAKILIGEAKNYVKENGADYLEAYPVHPDSHSYRFMGFVPVFEKAGFQFVKMAGTRRHVMIIKL